MSLRWRLTAVIGGVVALMVAGASFLAYVSADRQLNSQVNDFLVTRSREIERQLPGINFEQLLSGSSGDAFRFGQLTRPDAAAQLVTNEGPLISLTENSSVIELNAQDLAIANEPTDGDTIVRRLDSRMVDGTEYRVLTSSNELGALMVGRPVAEIEQTLAALRSWLITISLFGSLAAALVGWLVADRVLRPVTRLAAATQQVAETRQFDADLRVENHDELGALATSFNSMLSALRSSREQQHRLVRDASHELRTPLTSLRTNVDVLRRRGDQLNHAERTDLISNMDDEVRELTALVIELVDFATETSVADPSAFVPVDMRELVDNVAERTIRRTGRVVTVSGTETLPIDGDPTGLDRALGNIVGNAVKFSPADKPIRIVLTESSVEVWDRGPGIPDDEQVRVFDRFYRADQTRTEPGSGLGLAIVSDVATAHGGTTWSRAREGGGAIVGFGFAT